MPNVVTNRRVLMNPPRAAPFVGALDGFTAGLVVYEAFPPIFKLRDAGNPNGLGRTRAQLIEEGKLNAPSTAP